MDSQAVAALMAAVAAIVAASIAAHRRHPRVAVAIAVIGVTLALGIAVFPRLKRRTVSIRTQMPVTASVSYNTPVQALRMDEGVESATFTVGRY
jgi:cytochrome bd-type quinol oxidase subunit 2